MAAPHNVELEAAKFLQKLIHESTDVPERLATKLYVILQHMKASGKENTMPYQVISRAMETVINQHGLDLEALTSSRFPSSTDHKGESSTTHAAGSSQVLPITDPQSGMTENDSTRTDGFGSCRPLAAPNSLGPDLLQGSVSQRSGRSLDHESPSSIDTKSTNSHSHERRETASWEQQGVQKNSKRASVKRKKSNSSAMEPPDDSIQQPDSHNILPELKKERLTGKVEMPGSFPGVSESWKQGFQGAASFREKAVSGHLMSANQTNMSMANFHLASRPDAAGIQMSADRLLQTANPSTVTELGGLRSPASRDAGKSSVMTNMPFKEHHLKQLRAQCLVFLAFRNGLAPKRLHLEIALGNILTQEGTTGSVDGAQAELTSDRGKHPTTLESSCLAEAALARVNPAQIKNERVVMGTASTGCGPEVDASLNEAKNMPTARVKMGVLDDASHIDPQKHNPLGRGTFEDETQSQEVSNSSVLLTAGLQQDRSNMISPAVHRRDGSLQPGGTNHGDYVLATNNPLKPEMTRWTGAAQNDSSRSALPASVPYELGNGKDSSSNVSHHEGGINLSTSWNTFCVSEDDNSALDKTMSVTDGSKIVSGFDSSYIHRSPSPRGSEPEVDDRSVSTGLASSPKKTLSEKWIMVCQRRKVVNEQKWADKIQKADQRIACRFSELKETVSNSEDISLKTRSVIELKKLQLLELQRCLRRNIVNDFFKPVQSEMDQLKSIKKHRIGRRMKHVEKYEQKMKEERQKRIRERQKEFFSEIEVHRERLEDVFKYKRERCKGFNRYVKEFHKRKERIHREKIDRIQREKINLLKINDVEGYLRMVQDAKSDRVKQLLKETEKYLQKLGSKLQEAKTSAREADIDENHITTFDASSEIGAEAEDETDQAKHYKESNEKYYLIAHSIKENITDQPAGIEGGKLREYQMNGLRWLVSLYNNHLNGILADEMGLGKTVQVISLLCYLMEAKNDRGPFLVVVPSSVLPGWERELSFWAPGINKIVYSGPPEERRKLFKECIVHQKFNVLLTTYEYLMNKHDRPKLSKIHWHYVIIDEGHRIKNASCKLNADLKHYHSSHRLLLTGTPLQNSLEELWALLNFLLPNIFNSSEDFSQWFNKPFEGNGDNSPDEALLSEEENLLIINRLHQVLRPFVLRRLKHKVENQLPEKIERLVRCEASAYQKLLMMRVEENLGSLGMTKGRAIHNTVMELRNICNHPYLSHLHVEEVDSLIPKHFLPPIIRLCGKLEMLDRLLPKLKETNHRVLFFSTMTRLLDIMEDYLVWKQYRYLRLDGHTSGQDRGALIEKFNQPDSPFFIFLLSIRAGGVGVNLQAADTVIIFDTDWNPQVDLQAQARAHRIGQKKDVLVLRLETVKSVEEQVRAAAEHKLGVANQSITAGFFDNNTSAEDRKEYLESLLRESKKEEAAPVLDDDSLNDILARSESEIEVFEAIDQKRREEETATWKTLVLEHVGDKSEAWPALPSRLVTDDDLKAFYEAMKIHEAPNGDASSSSGVKRKGGYAGGFDNQHYGRGKRAREVRSYEEQWSEEEFEKMCQSEFPETVKLKDEKGDVPQPSQNRQEAVKLEIPLQNPLPPPSLEPSMFVKEVTPPVKRGRGRPRRTPSAVRTVSGSLTQNTIASCEPESQPPKAATSAVTDQSRPDSGNSAVSKDASGGSELGDTISPKRQGRKGQTYQGNIPGELRTETSRRRGRKPNCALPPAPTESLVQDLQPGEQQPSSDTCVSVNTSPKVTPDSTSADDSRDSLPKCSKSSDILGSKDTNPVELVPDNNLFDVSLKAATSPTHKETNKTEAPSLSQNAPVGHMAMLGDTLVENPELFEKSVKHSISSSSAVNVAPQEPRGAAGSTALPISGGIPIVKADLHIDSSQPTVSSSEVQPSSTTPRTSRRQSQKHQNAVEPVRRRGRKRGPSAVADSTLPVAQDQHSHEPLKVMGTMVTYIAPPTDMEEVAIPVAPLVSVSSLQTGSAAVTAVRGSMLHESVGFISSDSNSLQPNPVLRGAADIPSDTRRTIDLQTQGQTPKENCTETSRRRGRKKSKVSPLDQSVGQYLFSSQSDGKDADLADRKIITTRSRQVIVSQSPSTQGDIHSVTPFASSTSRDSVTVLTPCIEQSASLKADHIGKPLETRHTSPAEFPPISCKGKTNVIVLALDAISLDVDPVCMADRNAHDDKEISNLQIDSTLDASMLKPKISRSEAIHGTRSEVAKLDEELSAPPGFETSRLCVSNTLVTKSGELIGLGMSDSPDTKRGRIVLGLKSASQNTVPSFGCQNISAKEEISKVHSLKESGQGTVVTTLPEDCAENVDAATDKVISCQPEEDMLTPPGFDMPQQHLSERAAAKTLTYEDHKASDMPTGSMVGAEVEEDCPGPVGCDTGNDTSEATLVACVMDSDTTVAVTLPLVERGDIGGPGSAEQNLVDSCTSFVADPSYVEATTLELKEQEESHGANSGDIEHDISDASLLVESGTAAAVAVSLELATSAEPCNSVQNPVDASALSVAMESKEHEESLGPESDNVGHDCSDGQLAVSMVDSDTSAAPTLQLNGKGDTCGPGNVEENVIDACTACVDSPCNATTSALESKELGDSHGPGNTEQNAIDASTSCADSPRNVTNSEPKDQEEPHGPHNTEQNLVDASTACVNSPCNATTEQELHGLANNEQPVFDVSTASIDGPDIATTSALVLKDQESHGTGNVEQNVVDDSTVCIDDPYIATTKALEPKDQEELHGSGSTEQIVIDASTACVDGSYNETTSILDDSTACTDDPYIAPTTALEPKDQEELHGSGNTEQIVIDASTASVDDSYNETTSILESKVQVAHGPDVGESGDIGRNTIDAPLTVGVVDSYSTAVLTLELTEKDHPGSDNAEQNVVDTSSALVDGPCNVSASTSKSKEQGEPLGPCGAATSAVELQDQQNAVDASSCVAATSAMELQDQQNAVDASNAAALELKEQELSHGPDCGDIGYASGTSLTVGDVDAVPASKTLEMENKGEHLGPADTEQNMVDTSSTSAGIPFIATPSILDSENQEGSSVGPGSTEHNNPLSACGASSRNAEASNLESKEQEESRGPDDCNADLCIDNSKSDLADVSALSLEVEEAPVIVNCDVEHDAASSPSLVNVNEISEAITLRKDTSAEALNEEPQNVSVNCDVERDAASSPSSVNVNDTSEAIILTKDTSAEALNAEPQNVSVNCDVERDAASSPSSVNVTGTSETIILTKDTSAEALNAEPQDVIVNCDVERDAASSPSSVNVNDTSEAVILTKDTSAEALNAEPQNVIVNCDVDAASSPSSVNVNDTSEAIILTEDTSAEALNAEPQNGPNDGEAAEDVTGDNHTTSHVSSDTVVETTSESKEGEAEDGDGNDVLNETIS